MRLRAMKRLRTALGSPPLVPRRPGRGHRSRRGALLLLAVPVVTLLYMQALEEKRSSDRRVGAVVSLTDTGVVVTGVLPQQPAEEAGVQAGDRLVAVNGVPLPDLFTYHEVAQGFRRHEPITYTLERGGRVLDLEVFPGTAFPWTQFGIESVVVLTYLLLGMLAVRRWHEDLRARLLFLFTYAVALEMALPASMVGAPLAMILAACAYYLLTGAQMGIELHLSSVIPDPQPWLRRHRLVVPLFYVAGLAVGVLACLSYLAERLQLPFYPLLDQTLGDNLIAVALPVWAVAVGVLLVRQSLTHPTATGRHQAGLVLMGALPWIVYVVGTSVAPSFISVPGWVEIYVQPFAILCYPVAVAVAIYRYQLFDIEVVVRRGLVYTTLTGALVLVFYAAVGAGGALTAQVVEGAPSVWVIAAATLLLGLLFSPLHRAIQSVIENRFFPERSALRQRVGELAGELPATGKLPAMGKRLVSQLSEIFAVRSATLLLADPRSNLLLTLASSTADPDQSFDQSFLLSTNDDGVQALIRAGRPLATDALTAHSSGFAQRLRFFDAALAVPILLANRLVGLLLVGAKSSDEPFRAEETDLLSLLSHHVATVLENARLYESATVDGLTGLLRREAILDILGQEVARASRYHRPLAVGLADIDLFKRVNDTWGHLTGDAMLKLVARALASGLRTTDRLGRYGGEEFLFVLPETDLQGAQAVAEKLRHKVQEVVLPTEQGDVRVTVSIGLTSICSPWRGEDDSITDIIGAADLKLMQAKHEGRNRIGS